MTSARRSVSLTTTGPDGVVVEIQVSGPNDVPPESLRTRLDVTMRHVVDIFTSGEAHRRRRRRRVGLGAGALVDRRVRKTSTYASATDASASMAPMTSIEPRLANTSIG